MSTPTLHSELGASKAKRWMECPGSVNAERGLPDTKSDAAIEGTAAHALADKALTKGLDCDVWHETELRVAYRDRDGVEQFEHVEVDDDMVEYVQQYVDYVREKTGPDRMIEVQFSLAKLNPPEPMFGTSDVVWYNGAGAHMHVIDLKYGRGVMVDVHENEQLMYYALGAVVHLNVRPDKITVHIGQPRGQHPDGIFRTYTFDYARLVQFKKDLFRAAVLTQAADAPLVVGQHCNFCKAMPTCPAQLRHSESVAMTEFSAETPQLMDVTQLTKEQLSHIIQRSSIVEDFFKSVRSHVTDLLNAGEDVPGFKLVDGRANRKWADEEKAEQLLSGLLGDDAHNRKLLSVAQAEKALKKLSNTKLPPHMIQITRGRSLAPASSTKAALTPSVFDEFHADSQTDSQ